MSEEKSRCLIAVTEILNVTFSVGLMVGPTASGARNTALGCSAFDSELRCGLGDGIRGEAGLAVVLSVTK